MRLDYTQMEWCEGDRSQILLYVSSPDARDETPSSGTAIGQLRVAVAGVAALGQFSVYTNTSQQVRTRSRPASSTLDMSVSRYRNRRGRDG